MKEEKTQEGMTPRRKLRWSTDLLVLLYYGFSLSAHRPHTQVNKPQQENFNLFWCVSVWDAAHNKILSSRFYGGPSFYQWANDVSDECNAIVYWIFQTNPQEDTSEELEKAALRLETSNLMKRVRDHIKSGKSSKVRNWWITKWSSIDFLCFATARHNLSRRPAHGQRPLPLRRRQRPPRRKDLLLRRHVQRLRYILYQSCENPTWGENHATPVKYYRLFEEIGHPIDHLC